VFIYRTWTWNVCCWSHC